MSKYLVWYTSHDGRGDGVEVEADSKDAACDYVIDNYDADTVDNVEGPIA
jgi:hypothetical protein